MLEKNYKKLGRVIRYSAKKMKLFHPRKQPALVENLMGKFNFRISQEERNIKEEEKTQNAWGIFPPLGVSSGMDATWEVGPLPFDTNLERRLKGSFAAMVKKRKGRVMKKSLSWFSWRNIELGIWVKSSIRRETYFSEIHFLVCVLANGALE